MGLFCCVVAEFSYWQYFGTYIWFVIIGLRPLGQFLCAIVEEQLQEALLVMPVMTQCLSRNVSELQLRVDGVLATPRPRNAVDGAVREPPRLASEPRDRGTPRNGSKSTKRTPTTSSDGIESRRWRENRSRRRRAAQVMTAFDMTCGVITLSCDDFVDFMVLTQCVELELELDVVAAMASS